MKTILYYTSSREKPEFEKKIQKNILENCGNIPIISVSQKPINFGRNICVGDIGHSYESEFKQMLIGALEVKTKYIIFTEADFLYPKEYFSFDVGDEDIYRYRPVWLAFRKSNYFYKIPYSNGAQICKSKYVVYALKKNIKKPEWDTNIETEYINGNIPCVSFKTNDGMSSNLNYFTNWDKIAKERKKELPHWGTIGKVRSKFL